MTTAAKIGLGAEFRLGNGASPEVFTALGDVNSISGPTLSRDTPEATTLDSPSAWREYIPGLKDAGEVTLELNLTPASLTTLRNLFNNDVVSNYQVAYPFSPEKVWSFKAFITGMEMETPVDDKMSLSATFKITEPPTLSP